MEISEQFILGMMFIEGYKMQDHDLKVEVTQVRVVGNILVNGKTHK